MITINNPSKRMAKEPINEIEARFGIDFTLPNGDSFNVRLTPDREGVLIIKRSEDGAILSNPISIKPIATNQIKIQ